MRSSHLLIALAVAWVGLDGDLLVPSSPANAQSPKRDVAVEISGRAVSCGNVRVILDRRIPSEGAAAPGVLILNPRLLNEQPEIVRLFVFYHECGHHNVGDSELKADCWAIERGVRDGWLDKKGIKEVCQSFDGMPATQTHPSAKRRCGNLDQCFATSLAALAPASSAGAVAAPAAGRQAAHPPKLVSGPTLVGTGLVRYSGR
jgi:hypothetical protein